MRWMWKGKVVREPEDGRRPQNGRGLPKALGVGVSRLTHCEGRNGRSAGAPGGANRALIAAATANAPNAIRIVRVIGVLLVSRASAGGYSSPSPAAQPQPGASIGWFVDAVTACAAGASEAVPRAMPRIAARVRNLVFIVVLRGALELRPVRLAVGSSGLHRCDAT